MTEGRICGSNGRATGQRVRYDRTEGESPSVAVATALAEYYGEDVIASNVRLYDYVDPEAIDALFEATHTGTERTVRCVEFDVEETRVAVRPDCVEVTPFR